MEAKMRRQRVLALLETNPQAMSGTSLGEQFGVSRQIIVSDMALLRATGKNILSSTKGYYIPKNENQSLFVYTIESFHGKNEIREELEILVDNGATVVNVMIEHPVYGQMIADLQVANRHDIDCFMEKMKGTTPLSNLTDGNHIHTICCKSEEDYLRIEKRLVEKKFIHHKK